LGIEISELLENVAELETLTTEQLGLYTKLGIVMDSDSADDNGIYDVSSEALSQRDTLSCDAQTNLARSNGMDVSGAVYDYSPSTADSQTSRQEQQYTTDARGRLICVYYREGTICGPCCSTTACLTVEFRPQVSVLEALRARTATRGFRAFFA
jgi:hypothetical protein